MLRTIASINAEPFFQPAPQLRWMVTLAELPITNCSIRGKPSSQRLHGADYIRRDHQIPAKQAGTAIFIPATNPIERLNKEVKRRADVVSLCCHGG
jgi:hypothetical protein